MTTPTLKEFIIGDLGPARRHLERIRTGVLQPVPAVVNEIDASIERCVERVQRDVVEPVTIHTGDDDQIDHLTGIRAAAEEMIDDYDDIDVAETGKTILAECDALDAKRLEELRKLQDLKAAFTTLTVEEIGMYDGIPPLTENERVLREAIAAITNDVPDRE